MKRKHLSAHLGFLVCLLGSLSSLPAQEINWLTGGVTGSGSITGSEVWSGTVYVTGDITVTQTGNLTIMPGTRIQCDARLDDQVTGLHTSRIEIFVDRGTLNAVGTQDQPIVFTSWPPTDQTPPASGDWYGLRLNSPSIRLSHCTVEYATEGVRIEGGSPAIDHSLIQSNSALGVRLMVSASLSDCTILRNPTGINVHDGQTLNLDRSMVATNSGDGIAGMNSITNVITDCVVSGNGGHGIRNPDGCEVGPGSLTIYGSRIINNSANGILMGGGGCDSLGWLKVSDSTIANNGQFGIGGSTGCPWYCNKGSGYVGEISILDTFITNNGAGAVEFSRLASVVRSTILANGSLAIGNRWDAGQRSLVLEDSIVSGNLGDAIRVGSGSIRNSTISDNISFALNVPESLVVSNSTINDNGGYGISAGTLTLQNSTISGNSGFGITLTGLGPEGLTGNLIDHNQVGIIVNSSAASLYGITNNNIFNNLTYELQNQGSAAVVADGNFWGEPTTTELVQHVRNQTMIYDVRDNASVGQVAIRNWASAHVTPSSGLAITIQPQGQAVDTGGTITLSVAASGIAPLRYQWFKDGQTISGATEAALILRNVKAGDAGLYWARVSNDYSSAESSEANVVVLPEGAGLNLGLQMYPGIMINGQVGQSCTVQSAENLTPPVNWQPLTNFIISEPITYWVDMTSPGKPRRFYRAVLDQ